jgi:acetyl esterase/lipase
MVNIKAIPRTLRVVICCVVLTYTLNWSIEIIRFHLRVSHPFPRVTYAIAPLLAVLLTIGWFNGFDTFKLHMAMMARSAFPFASAGAGQAISASATEREAWPEITPSFADLTYAEKSPAEKLDLYLPVGRGAPARLVIWIHGGAFRVGDKRSMPRQDFGPAPKPRGLNGPYQIQVPNVAALVARGYAVASLNYRLGNWFVRAALPAIQDSKAAVRFLRANAAKYNLNPNQFAVWGNSVGGYMTAMLGVTGDQSTLFDDPTLGNAGVSSAVQACVVWFGAEDRLPPKLRVDTYAASAKVLPTFRIVNGSADPVISARQAQRLHRTLTKTGARATLTILRGAGHEDPAFMANEMEPTFAFLDEALTGLQADGQA